MSVIAYTASSVTTGKILYMKESVLLARNLPTKVMLRFIASFKKEDYQRLLEDGSPHLTILTHLNIWENSTDLLLHKLVQAELTKRATSPLEYGFRTDKDKKAAERYLAEIKRFTPTDEISDDWVGLRWQPRGDIGAIEFYVPLRAKLMPKLDTEENSTIQKIRIELPKHIPPLLREHANIGLMIEFKTEDIPSFRDSKIIITNIEIYNWENIGEETLERSRILTPVAGELWIQHPINAFVQTTYPEAGRPFVDTVQDEKVAREISAELYYVGRLTEYMPAASKESIRWYIDKHIKDWSANNVSFTSIACFFEEFQEDLKRQAQSHLRSIFSSLEKRTQEHVSQTLSFLSQSGRTIFLCHSTLDKEFVDRLTDDLNRNGILYWLDTSEIKVGEPIPDKISEAIQNYDFFGIILSKNSMNSAWVKIELDAAFMKEIKEKRTIILPILIEDCAIPPIIQSRRFADFRFDYGKGLCELLDVLRS